MDMRRRRSTREFALSLGLDDPHPAVSRCPEQQGNTCTVNTPLFCQRGWSWATEPAPHREWLLWGLCSPPGTKHPKGIKVGSSSTGKILLWNLLP